MEGRREVVVVVVGNSQCGKSKLIHRFAKNTFNQIYVKTGFDKVLVTHHVGGTPWSFTIWDTSGLESYAVLRPLVYREADVVLVCYALSDEDGLDTVPGWVEEVRKHCAPSTPLLLCGCARDMATKDDLETALAVSEEVDAVNMLTCSARTGEDVEQVFELCALAYQDGKSSSSKKVIKRPITMNKSTKGLSRSASYCGEADSGKTNIPMDDSIKILPSHVRQFNKKHKRSQSAIPSTKVSSVSSLTSSGSQDFIARIERDLNKTDCQRNFSRESEHTLVHNHRLSLSVFEKSPFTDALSLYSSQSKSKSKMSHSQSFLTSSPTTNTKIYEIQPENNFHPASTKGRNTAHHGITPDPVYPGRTLAAPPHPGRTLATPPAQVRPNRLCRRTTFRSSQARAKPVPSPMSPNCLPTSRPTLYLPLSPISNHSSGQSPTESSISSDIHLPLPFLPHKFSNRPSSFVSLPSPTSSLMSGPLSPTSSFACSTSGDPSSSCLPGPFSPTFTTDPLSPTSFNSSLLSPSQPPDMSDNSSISGASHTGSTSVSCKQIPTIHHQRQCQLAAEERDNKKEHIYQTIQECFPWTDKSSCTIKNQCVVPGEHTYRTTGLSRRDKCIVM